MSDAKSDREEILSHIDTIFRAYIRKDREVIRSTRTPDWTGFQGPSVKIERGLVDYMVNAEKSLEHFDGTGHEILDSEVQIYGNIGIVYYIARYDYRDREGTAGSLLLRSVDLYRKDPAGWIQIGSHITPLPQGGSWGEE